MGERADIFRLHGPESRAQCGDRMPASPLRAMQDIAQCRTDALGGHLLYGEPGQQSHDSDHSCKHRHCPPCQHDQAHAWLDNHKSLLLPVPHFLVTFPLSDPLRVLARSPQKALYTILFRSSSDA